MTLNDAQVYARTTTDDVQMDAIVIAGHAVRVAEDLMERYQAMPAGPVRDRLVGHAARMLVNACAQRERAVALRGLYHAAFRADGAPDFFGDAPARWD